MLTFSLSAHKSCSPAKIPLAPKEGREQTVERLGGLDIALPTKTDLDIATNNLPLLLIFIYIFLIFYLLLITFY
jgi:hypothetical protein